MGPNVAVCVHGARAGCASLAVALRRRARAAFLTLSSAMPHGRSRRARGIKARTAAVRNIASMDNATRRPRDANNETAYASQIKFDFENKVLACGACRCRSDGPFYRTVLVPSTHVPRARADYPGHSVCVPCGITRSDGTCSTYLRGTSTSTDVNRTAISRYDPRTLPYGR